MYEEPPIVDLDEILDEQEEARGARDAHAAAARRRRRRRRHRRAADLLVVTAPSWLAARAGHRGADVAGLDPQHAHRTDRRLTFTPPYLRRPLGVLARRGRCPASTVLSAAPRATVAAGCALSSRSAASRATSRHCWSASSSSPPLVLVAGLLFAPATARATRRAACGHRAGRCCILLDRWYDRRADHRRGPAFRRSRPSFAGPVVSRHGARHGATRWLDRPRAPGRHGYLLLIVACSAGVIPFALRSERPSTPAEPARGSRRSPAAARHRRRLAGASASARRRSRATSLVAAGRLAALLLALGRDGGGAGGGRLRVEVARRRGRHEVVVELVDERDAGRDVELGDLVVARCRRGA